MESKQPQWPLEVQRQARELHAQLSINDHNWHQLKGDADHRTAELLAAALVQLLQGGKREDVEALTDQGLHWIRRELKAPGCGRE
ncbi:MAG: DUF6439 family protein [Prochlorococcus sp.]|jgi:hypothetical protein|nr:DUF6439 family protein [Prochlorococcaceae cyanobacterium ETNP2_MAG_10]MDP6202690.1 DUF6439 family protein [Prochlorococcaceae cyanobacterium ETNP18_MAG_14]MDP6310234.1 DUF6439 family protein [Prochlorococcaceae cyanobacterium ETNP14_MAG_4]|tara:strand:+ start:633 stop:887 length:255 start_codon:yes stop_codon:yes gene_type:complete